MNFLKKYFYWFTWHRSLGLCLISLVITIGSGLWYGNLKLTDWDRRNWPTVAGKIIDSQLNQMANDSSYQPTKFYWRADIVYQYEVDGQIYESNKWSSEHLDYKSGAPQSPAPEKMHEIVKKYFANKFVDAQFNPKDNSQAFIVFKPYRQTGWLLLFLVSIHFFAISLLAYIRYVKRTHFFTSEET